MPLTSGPTKSLNERTLIHRPLRGAVLVRFVETPHRVTRAFGRFEVKRIDTHASIKMFSGLRNPGHCVLWPPYGVPLVKMTRHVNESIRMKYKSYNKSHDTRQTTQSGRRTEDERHPHSGHPGTERHDFGSYADCRSGCGGMGKTDYLGSSTSNHLGSQQADTQEECFRSEPIVRKLIPSGRPE
jgi:hypothetical protein